MSEGRPLRVVLLGANGLLGSELHRCFTENQDWQVRRFERNELNLSDALLIERALGEIEFDWLVNAAAYTSVDDCETQPDHANLINGHAPGQIARLCAAKGARMLHFSTDYVFDGRKTTPYTEDDEPCPISAYGRSKFLGERQVLSASEAHVVLRISWLFGGGRPAFPEWVMRQAVAGSLKVVADKRGCPTHAREAALATRRLLELESLPGGVLHFCHPPATTWFDYAQAILAETGGAAELIPIAMRDLPGLVAHRPDHSALAVGRYEQLTGQRVRPWPEVLHEYVHGK